MEHSRQSATTWIELGCCPTRGSGGLLVRSENDLNLVDGLKNERKLELIEAVLMKDSYVLPSTLQRWGFQHEQYQKLRAEVTE